MLRVDIDKKTEDIVELRIIARYNEERKKPILEKLIEKLESSRYIKIQET